MTARDGSGRDEVRDLYPTNSELLTFLTQRFGGHQQMKDAVAQLRERLNYKGHGATFMDAATHLYRREKHKQRAEPA